MCGRTNVLWTRSDDARRAGHYTIIFKLFLFTYWSVWYGFSATFDSLNTWTVPPVPQTVAYITFCQIMLLNQNSRFPVYLDWRLPSPISVLHTLHENFILTSTDPARYLHFDLFWVQLHKNGCFWNNTNVDVNVSRQHLDHITHYISLPLHTTSYVVLPRTTRGQCGCFLEVTREFVLITFRRNVIVNFYYAVKSHCEIMNHIHSATVSWSLWNVTYTWLQFMCGYVKWIIDEGRAYVGGRRWKTLLGMETWNYLLSLLPPRPTLSERKIHLV